MNLIVPYFSQKEEAVVELYGYSACGLVSVRMILGFYKKSTGLNRLTHLADLEKAFDNEKGWIHSKLLNISRKFSLKGFRINYNTLTEEDLGKAAEVLTKEGTSKKEFKEFIKNFKLAKKKGAMAAMENLLKRKIPVIASMKRSFAATPTTHLLVVKGVENGKVLINDPWQFGPSYTVIQSRFEKQWTKRLVVIYQSGMIN